MNVVSSRRPDMKGIVTKQVAVTTSPQMGKPASAPTTTAPKPKG